MSVFRAKQAFPAVSFFRSDLMAPAVQPEAFDLVYCAGMLHNTPETRRALEALAPTVKPGGRLYVWLYWHVPGWKFAVRQGIRRVTSRLPSRLQQPVVDALALPPYLLGRRLAWRDHRVVAHDYFTPRYRWEHTPHEVQGWLERLGFRDVRLVTEEHAGFGMLAFRPGGSPS